MANNSQTQLLQSKIRAMQAQSNVYTGGSPNEKPKQHISTISHIFNILQRPKNAVTRTLDDVITAAKKGDVLGAIDAPVRGTFTGGIMGKSKSTADILSNQFGVKNKWALALGGLAGDVLLDPVTYLSLGTAKAVEAPELAAETAGAVEKAVTASKATEGLSNKIGAGTRAVNKNILAEEIAGKTIPEAEKAAKVAAKRAETVGKVANPAAEESATALKDAYGGPRVQVKAKLPFSKGEGKLLTEIPLDKPYGGLSKVGKEFLATKTGDSLANFFSTAHLYGESGRKWLRTFTNAGAAEFEKNVATEIRPLFKGLDPEHKTSVLNALHGTESVAGSEVKNANGQTLQEIHDALRKRWDQHFDDAVLNGIYKPSQKTENYVPQYFQEKGANYNKFVKDRRAGKMVQALDENGVPMLDKAGTPLMKKVAKFTTQDAAAAGLKPIDDLEQIAVMREAKQVAQKSHWQVTHALLKDYGVHIADADAAKWAKENGMTKVTDNLTSHSKAAKTAMFDIASDDAKFAKSELSKYDNWYIPERVAGSLKNIDKFHNEPEAAGQFLRMVDQVQKPWKFMATAFNPGHHFKNLVGDMFLNYEDGVVDPRHYAKAWDLVGRDVGPKRTEEAIQAARAGVKVKVGEGTIDGNRLMQWMNERGARSGMIRQEFGGEGKGVKGAVEWIRNKGEAREDFGRVAHFIHAVEEEGRKAGLTASEVSAGLGNQKVLDAVDRAAARVRHWNIDYGDLTPAERKYLGRTIPFYTFMRKNIPLQMEALALRPDRIVRLPKAATALQTMLTGQTQQQSDIADILPQYIQDTMHIKIMGEGEGHSSVYWLPSTPFEDMTKYFQGGPKGMLANLLSSTSPLMKVPIEEAYGRQSFGSQAPITNQNQYAAGQMPIGRELYALLHSGKGKSGKVAGRNLGVDQLINYLTGQGIQEITPEEQKSELMRQQNVLQGQIRSAKAKRKRAAQK